MSKDKKNPVVIVTIIVCLTLLILAGLGAFVYVSQQNLAQKDKELNAQIKAEDQDRLIDEYNACILAADAMPETTSAQAYGKSYAVSECRDKYQ